MLEAVSVPRKIIQKEWIVHFTCEEAKLSAVMTKTGNVVVVMLLLCLTISVMTQSWNVGKQCGTYKEGDKEKMWYATWKCRNHCKHNTRCGGGECILSVPGVYRCRCYACV
ncbi:unnamed protein product [Cylicocyclus nassatus]|uniref:Defensin n=1 Tax=Cylicocyclus nassatus TaxID=53992 RepID=A0AA36DRV8_CYLNA|nr:unnamed protein product [Cylicocyclus nassatus]